MRSSPDGVRRWVSKHVTGICGVGKFLQLWGNESTDGCPLCGEPETARHVPRCRDPRMVEEWNLQLQALRDWLDERQTHHDISHAITDLLFRWRFDLPPSTFYPPGVRSAVQAQSQIGIRGLLEGLLSTEWASLQQRAYEDAGSRRSGHQWAALLVSHLWSLGMSLWDFRNDIMHSPDSLHARADNDEVNNFIRSAYESGTADLSADGIQLLSLSLSSRLASPLPDKLRWRALVEADHVSAQRVRRRARLQRRRFEAFFDRTHETMGS